LVRCASRGRVVSLVGIGAICAEGDTQPRCQLNMFAVDEYADALAGGADFPPVVVFFDGEDYWLADGFHRLRAHEKLGHQSIVCDVREGGRDDAIEFACAANTEHGLQRTADDKRRAIEKLVALEKWQGKKIKQSEIAAHVKVTQGYVSKVLASIPGNTMSETVVRSDGRVRRRKRKAEVGAQLTTEQRSLVAEAGLADPKTVAQIEKVAPDKRSGVIEKLTSGEARNPRAAVNQLAREERAAEATPAPERDGFRVIEGDAVSVLADMADGSIRLVVTDPPYGIDTHTTRKGGHDYADGEDYALDLLDRTAAVLAQKCHPQAHLYFFSGYTHAWRFRQVLGQHFDVQDNPLIWVKSRHTMAEERLWYASRHEYVWFCRMRGATSPLMKWSADVLEYATQSDTDHSAEKPVELLKFLINQSSVGGELVVDPFCGSGSTGVAAAALERAFVGIEVDPAWAEVARGRV